MKKADFWKSDWFFGVVVSVVVLILGNGDLLQGLERKAYDMGVAATTRAPSDKVAVIAIDKPSLDNIGRWPWSREIMADMVDKLAAAKAKVIATTVFYSEPQRDQGLAYINKLIETCGVTLPSVAAVAAIPAAPGSWMLNNVKTMLPALIFRHFYLFFGLRENKCGDFIFWSA